MYDNTETTKKCCNECSRVFTSPMGNVPDRHPPGPRCTLRHRSWYLIRHVSRALSASHLQNEAQREAQLYCTNLACSTICPANCMYQMGKCVVSLYLPSHRCCLEKYPIEVNEVPGRARLRMVIHFYCLQGVVRGHEHFWYYRKNAHVCSLYREEILHTDSVLSDTSVGLERRLCRITEYDTA
jgi:hypothetical protein